jgi:Domain of unknown function (DUF3870)
MPATTTSHATHEFLSISVLIKPPSTTVIAVESTAVTVMTQDWLSSLLVGADLAGNESTLVEAVDAHYLGGAAGGRDQVGNS